MFITLAKTMNYNEKQTMDTWSKRTQTNPILPATAGKIAPLFRMPFILMGPAPLFRVSFTLMGSAIIYKKKALLFSRAHGFFIRLFRFSRDAR
jgi:hypothetical protein